MLELETFSMEELVCDCMNNDETKDVTSWFIVLFVSLIIEKFKK